jgi:TRAP-type uncharacterized transport system fused permease subunit
VALGYRASASAGGRGGKRSPPMATGFTAFGLCKGLYIIPLLFAFTPILGGDPTQMLLVFVPAIVGLHALSAAMSGVVETRIGVVGRLVAGAVGASLLWPRGLEIKMPLMLIYLGYTIFDWRRRRIGAALQKSDTEVRPLQR